jgi:hypothetical protein
MANKNKGRGRPKFHWWLAEQCYVLVDEVERQNKPITRRQAIYKFLEGPKFANLVVSWEKGIEDIKQNHRDILRDYQSHDDLEDTKKYMIECGYDYLEPETGEFFKESDLVAINEDYQTIKKQFESIPDAREPGDRDTGLSERAYKVILRLIEIHQKYVDDLKARGLL